MRKWHWLLPAVFVLALATSTAASASYLVTRNASEVTLAVDDEGRALVSYTTSQGARKHVLVWGAINALSPVEGTRQVAFEVDYTGGVGTYKWQVWKKFDNRCEPYDGPELHWLVAACRAPDGSYWALQSWQRARPYQGKQPWTPYHESWELRVSHWTGELAKLEVWQGWKYSAMFESAYARYTYLGVPVYPLPKGTPGWTGFLRRVYIDTLNSNYGPGWWRADALSTHPPTGVVCAIFAENHFDPRWGWNRGAGERYRITIPGPGVTPDIYWEGASLGPWDPNDPVKVAEQQALDQVVHQLADRDPRCSQLAS
jgi:hypothetical protein